MGVGNERLKILINKYNLKKEHPFSYLIIIVEKKES